MAVFPGRGNGTAQIQAICDDCKGSSRFEARLAMLADRTSQRGVRQPYYWAPLVNFKDEIPAGISIPYCS
jgi:hypothetical protein